MVFYVALPFCGLVLRRGVVTPLGRPLSSRRANKGFVWLAAQGPSHANAESGHGYHSVAALLAAEARPGDTTFTFSSPTLSVKLSLPPPRSVTEASLARVQGGSLQHARMVRTPFVKMTPPDQCCYPLMGSCLMRESFLAVCHGSLQHARMVRTPFRQNVTPGEMFLSTDGVMPYARILSNCSLPLLGVKYHSDGAVVVYWTGLTDLAASLVATRSSNLQHA
jgi:hypothetical protein